MRVRAVLISAMPRTAEATYNRESRVASRGIRDATEESGISDERSGIDLAGVAELADARDLKSRGRKAVWVRSPPPALKIANVFTGRASFVPSAS